MTTLFHKSFGRGSLISEDDTNLVVNFDTIGEKRLLKKFAKFINEEEYVKLQNTPKSTFTIPKPTKHELRLLSDVDLISTLKTQEDGMQRNYYFDIDEVVNSEIYFNGVDYFSSTKELIGDSWKLAMYFAKEK